MRLEASFDLDTTEGGEGTTLGELAELDTDISQSITEGDA